MWKSQHLNCGEYIAVYYVTTPAILQGGESFALYALGSSMQDMHPQMQTIRSSAYTGGTLYDATLPAIILDHDDSLIGDFVTHGFTHRVLGPMVMSFKS